HDFRLNSLTSSLYKKNEAERALVPCRPSRFIFPASTAISWLTSVVANFYVDLPGFRALLFGEGDRQHAVFVIGFHMLCVHRVRHRERPLETAVGPLDTVITTLIARFLELALTFERQRVVLEVHLDIFESDVRHIGFHHQLILVLRDI